MMPAEAAGQPRRRIRETCVRHSYSTVIARNSPNSDKGLEKEPLSM